MMQNFGKTLSRSGSLEMFFKIGILKDFANLTRKHLRWSLFLTKLQALRHATLSKRDLNTGVFLRNLQNY